MESLLSNIQSAYFIGIKGVGMTAFAEVLKAQGVFVSGSDTKEQFFTDAILQKLEIPYYEGFTRSNVPDSVDVVVVSPAYLSGNHPEVVVARERGLKVISWHTGVATLFNDRYGIAVCGTSGKSTTTAMLGCILDHAGYDPTVIVGSRVNAWKSNARVGKSQYFVIEADEYKEAFLHYYPKMALVTNIEYDHPDYFETEEAYKKAFATFLKRVPKDTVFHTPDTHRRFTLALPGEHNQENARLAHKAALALGIEDSVIEEALKSFSGLARRFEYYGEYRGAVLYDDYAHHPTEITAFIQGAREKYPHKNIVVLFQPHTFSRTEALFDAFSESLLKADEVHILTTYGSAREERDDTLGKRLAHSVQGSYFSSVNDAVTHFQKTLSSATMFATVGAGEGWQVVRALAQRA